MKALRQQVERMVRPLRASTRTKDRLRAELLAHLTLLEQWSCVPLPGTRWGQRRRGETIGKWIFRTTIAGSLASGLAILLLVVVLAALDNKLNRLGPVVPFLLVVPFLMWITLVTNFGCSE